MAKVSFTLDVVHCIAFGAAQCRTSTHVVILW